MSCKVKSTIGDVSAEIEIPLSERSVISLDDDGTAKKTLKIFEDLNQKVLEAAQSFEKSRAALYPPLDPIGKKRIIKIKTAEDLPPYGVYVLVKGTDEAQYGIKRWHVCEMNDLEDGIEFAKNGSFEWLTEKGTKITGVTEWCWLPETDDSEK